MRLREMRTGQRERSGNWRADYLETRTVGSEEVGWKRAARAVPRQPPILPLTSVLKRDRFRPRISPVRSVFSRLLPRVSQLAGRVWLSRSRRLFRLFPRCVLSSPAMLTVCRRGRVPCHYHAAPRALPRHYLACRVDSSRDDPFVDEKRWYLCSRTRCSTGNDSEAGIS
jgi:hypothetical protein